MHNELELRRTAERDLPFVMATESAPECKGLVGQSPAAEHLRVLVDPSREHWIVLERQVPVGFAITYDLTPSNAGCYLKRIVIVTKGQGVGRRAVALLASHAAAVRGSPYIWLGVLPHNTRAIRCYEACGFVPFEASPAELLRHKSLADGSALDACLLYRLNLDAEPAA
jgi:diamine N-acetyltransferase